MSIDRAASFTVKGRGMLRYSDGKLRAEPGREDQLWVTAGTGGLILFDAGPGVAFAVGGVNEAFAVGFGAPMPGYDDDGNLPGGKG